MNAVEKLNSKIKEGKHICVGLDSDIPKIPKFLLGEKNPILTFNKKIIDATLEEAAAYKLNFAFYESQGVKGWEALIETVNYLPDDILIIADAKKGDIGNTSAQYARAIFEELKFDAATLNPLMGWDSIKPFADYAGKISFVLGLTSNPSASDFEKLLLSDGQYLFQKIIFKVKQWNVHDNLGLVFGATNTEELQSNFELLRDLPLLLPGVGTQGGSFKDIKKFFFEKSKKDFIVNISRSLIFADVGKDFQKKVADKIKEFNTL